MFSSATPLPLRHNLVVNAITFEGFKLRSSNLTHALLIQISRTSSIIDIVVPSKMAAGGHFVQKCDQKWHPKWSIDLKWPEMRSKVIFDIQNGRWKKQLPYRSELARNAIESEFWTSKMADRSEMARNHEMQLKVILGHTKWPTVAILSKFKNKVPYRSEMARNVIKSDFWTSKMAASGHF